MNHPSPTTRTRSLLVYEDDLELLSEADMLEKALEELNVESVMDEEVYHRIAIAFVYFNVLGAPPREMWGKNRGNMAKIKDILNIPSVTKIDYVLEDLVECKAKKRRYTGKRQASGQTRPPKIPNGSREAQIVTNHLEAGFSIRQATLQVNDHRRENDQEEVFISAEDELTDEANAFMDSQGKDGNRPEWFLADKLTKIDLTKVVFWDETHRKCVIGQGASQAGRKFHLKFRRDANGKLNPGMVGGKGLSQALDLAGVWSQHSHSQAQAVLFPSTSG
ncbi:unknown protein [Seminavis robusta]|uniref:Uncharacterized protein n=1 Tax=Seminavis robusta TaxID=568900 RepID=A0A9N8EMA5_9STRA|nr:unknown protein [Seminavis robusta]|eukprot:Sro1532_g280240.1 n/a (277) ;mRNA; r:10602-11570